MCVADQISSNFVQKSQIFDKESVWEVKCKAQPMWAGSSAKVKKLKS